MQTSSSAVADKPARGVSHFERKFQGEGVVVHQRILASEN